MNFRCLGGFLRDFDYILVTNTLNTQGIGNNPTVSSEFLAWSVYQESRKRSLKPSMVNFKHQEWFKSILRQLSSNFMILRRILWTDRGFYVGFCGLEEDFQRISADFSGFQQFSADYYRILEGS